MISKNIFDCGFVIPLIEEAEPLLKIAVDLKEKRIGSRSIYSGIIKNKRCAMIVSGCGKIRSASATQLLIDKHPSDLYIHYGTAGALSPKLKIGDLILAKAVIEHDVIELFPEKVPPPIHSTNNKVFDRLSHKNGLILGDIASGDEDIVNRQRRTELLTKTASLCVDWESAGFLLTCNLNNVDSLIIRGISDLAHENSSGEYRHNQKFVIRKILKTIQEEIIS